jgi:hypothetical protein
MIKILILTDDKLKWDRFIRHLMTIDRMYENNKSFHLENQMFHFDIRNSFPESMRGAAYAHVILDKQLDKKTFYEILMPTIKQRITSHGLDKLLNN